MTALAVVFKTERFLAVMAGTAGLALFHGFHAHSFMLFDIFKKFWVAFQTFQPCRTGMDLMAEKDITSLVFHSDITTANNGKSHPSAHQYQYCS